MYDEKTTIDRDATQERFTLLFKDKGWGIIGKGQFKKAYAYHVDNLGSTDAEAIATAYASGEINSYTTAPVNNATNPATLLIEKANAQELIGISLSFAREHSISDAVIYPILQRLQSMAGGKHFTVSGQSLHTAARCLKTRQTAFDALERLEAAKLIQTQSTGIFQSTRVFVAECAPATDLVYFRASDAIKYDGAKALILAQYEQAPVARVGEWGKQYKKLCAASLAKLLPMSEKTIRGHLKQLVKAGALIKMASNFYCRG